MTTQRRRGATMVALSSVVALLLAACSDEGASHGGGGAAGHGAGPQVVATTAILGDVARHIVGETGHVDVLIKPGTDPHEFAPSARQAAELREADVVVANGLQLVPSLDDSLQAAEDSGVDVVRVARHVDPLPFATDQHEHDTDGDKQHEGEHEAQNEAQHEHEHGTYDPHVWLDPVRMADAIRLIGTHIAHAAPGQDRTVRGQANDYAARVMNTHQTIRAVVEDIPDNRRVLVTNHDSLGYFAERYDFHVIGTVLPGDSTLAEPSSADLTTLATLLTKTGVPAIFADTTAPTKLAETVRREAGTDVAVIPLFTDSLGKKKARSYLDLLSTDAHRIADGLTT